MTEALSDKVNILGDSEKRCGIFSFTAKKADVHELAGILNSANIMIRSGVHCCHSWFNSNNINGSARASLYFYNTEEEAEKFIKEINKIIKVVS